MLAPQLTHVRLLCHIAWVQTSNSASVQEAIDIDSVAVYATRANLDLNGCTDRCHVTAALPTSTDADPLDETQQSHGGAGGYDVVVANILKPVLLDLRARLTGYVRPGGTLLLTGILERQVEDIKRAYDADFDWEDVRVDQEWALLIGNKKRILKQNS